MSKKPQKKFSSFEEARSELVAIVDSDEARQSVAERAKQLVTAARAKRDSILERAKERRKVIQERMAVAAETLSTAITAYTELLGLASELAKALGEAQPKTEEEINQALQEDDAESPVRVYAEVASEIKALENRFPGIQKLSFTDSLIAAVRRDVEEKDPEALAKKGLSAFDILEKRVQSAVNLRLVEQVPKEPERGLRIWTGARSNRRHYVARKFDLSNELERKLYERTRVLFDALHGLRQACASANAEYRDVRKAHQAEGLAKRVELREERGARIAELGTTAATVEALLKGEDGLVAGFVPGWKARDKEGNERETVQYLEVEGKKGTFVVARTSSSAFKSLAGTIAKADPGAKIIVAALHRMAAALKQPATNVPKPKTGELEARGLSEFVGNGDELRTDITSDPAISAEDMDRIAGEQVTGEPRDH